MTIVPMTSKEEVSLESSDSVNMFPNNRFRKVDMNRL